MRSGTNSPVRHQDLTPYPRSDRHRPGVPAVQQGVFESSRQAAFGAISRGSGSGRRGARAANPPPGRHRLDDQLRGTGKPSDQAASTARRPAPARRRGESGPAERPRCTPGSASRLYANIADVNSAVYLRVSKDSTGEGLAVDRQRSDALETAKRYGWQVSRIETDNDMSAAGKRYRSG